MGHFIEDSCPYHDEYYADCPYCLWCRDADCSLNAGHRVAFVTAPVEPEGW